ncbi:MAG: quinoprotein relay system zinc metallohydrolase 2 [Methylophaga sp.]|nr:quinoprotein relay system zinc metallohydrolase 2 [Methylophaga sp.]
MLASMNKTYFITLLLLLPALHGCAKAETSDYPLMAAAEGIYFHQGAHEEATPDNHGAIANIGFIVGESCVAVVDTGGSYLEGQQLRNAIRNITETPICYVINTHVHPDHVLGNAAFLQDNPVFIAHQRAPAALAARQTFYKEGFQELLGDAWHGTEFIPASKLVNIDQPVELDLGGRIIKLESYPTAHTDHDLTVLDKKTRTLWTGDLLFVDRTPALDGSINGWLNAMQHLLKMDVEVMIPGHGPVSYNGDKTALRSQIRYFEAIREGVRAIINDLGTIEQAIREVAVDESDNWLMFEEYHRRNVTAAFVELEWE